ncbi:hypothetical protein D3C72_1881900 [compost metagenome]
MGVADLAGEDLGGVGGGVQRERQDGADVGLAQVFPRPAVAHPVELRQAVVDDEQLHQQRGAAEHVGVQPHRARDPLVARYQHQRHRHRQQQAEGQRQAEQLQRQLQAVGGGHDRCTVGAAEEGRKAFDNQVQVDHSSVSRTPVE